MSLIREVINGYAVRLRMENELQLKRIQYKRPKEIAKELTKFDMALKVELADPEFKASYDTILTMLTTTTEPA